MGREEYRSWSRFKTVALLFLSSVTGDAVEFVDEHLAVGNLRGWRIMRETVEAGHHWLCHYPEREEASDNGR